MSEWPTFRVKRSNGRIAINPNLVSGVYESVTDNVTEVYTLDCSKDEDAWDIKEDFDSVVRKLTKDNNMFSNKTIIACTIVMIIAMVGILYGVIGLVELGFFQ